MILVAGLTPAWQQILQFDAFSLGEVNRAREVHWCASGKVLNVGVALAHLQVASHTLAPLGGWARSAIEQEFAAHRIDATWVTTSAPTRVCTTILDADRSQTTELVQNAGSLSETELETFAGAFRRLVVDASAVVITGSLPAGTPPTIYGELLAGVGVPIVLDIRGPELLAALPHRPALVKPNREELGHTVGRSLATEADVFAAMRDLIACGARAVLVSHGKTPSLLATETQAWRIAPASVERVVNPIGCGDCLAAGVEWGIVRKHSLVESVRLGMGAAADNLRKTLPARLDPNRVERLAARVIVERL